MAREWSSNPHYSHGYLVPLFALALLWLRRDSRGHARPQVNLWGLGLIGIGVLLRLVSAYIYFDWLDALSLLPVLAGLCLLLGGWPLLRWSWPAIAFLFFMIPLPYTLETGLAYPLRRVATLASNYCLQTLGLPAVAEGNVIRMNEIKIGVVEACSGLSMLMIFFALSTAVAIVIRRPVWEKLVIVVSAVPIALFANVVRIAVTGILHMTIGSELANAFFHDFAGWMMMPLALALLWLELQLFARLFVELDSSRPMPLGLAR